MNLRITFNFRKNGDERISEPPPSGIDQGVLPRLIARLVIRRRAVKSLIKDRSTTQARLSQVSIMIVKPFYMTHFISC